MKKITIPRYSTRVERKTVFMALAAAMAILAAGYAGYGFTAWSSYEVSYQRHEKDSRDVINSTLRKKISDQYTTTDKLASIREESSRIREASESQCRLPTGLGWLMRLDGVKQEVGRCEELMNGLVTEVQQLHDKSVDIEFENRLARILKEAADRSQRSSSPDSWQASHQAWTDAAEDAEGLIEQNPEIRSEYYARILTSLREIESAWKRVIDASEAKDESGFEDAKERLLRAYGELTSSSE